MLTAAQNKRLAKEARKLAMECVEGTAPQLITNTFLRNDRCCVLGEVGRRIGLRSSAEMAGAFYGGSFEQSEAASAAAEANNDATDDDRHGAVVFPLLALADALEAKAATPNTREGD